MSYATSNPYVFPMNETTNSYAVPPSAMPLSIPARHANILARAAEIREQYGDPVQNLANLLGNMPGSQADWEALVDEPY